MHWTDRLTPFFPFQNEICSKRWDGSLMISTVIKNYKLVIDRKINYYKNTSFRYVTSF